MTPNDQLPADVVINGYQTIEVQAKDGTKVSVKVRIVALSKVVQYLDAVSDITALVELVTEQPKGFADTLTDDAVYEIDELARKLNDPRIDRFLERQKKAVGKLAPMAREFVALTKS